MVKSLNNVYKKIVDIFYRENIYFAYTFCFIIMSILVFWPFLESGTSLIWKIDISYNFKPMIYASNYFREFFKNLLINHRIVLPQYDFTLWEGYDIINALHWPAIGDPFYFFSFIIDERYMFIYYEFVIICKLYLAGIGFILLLKYKGVYNNFALLAGSFTYIFCFFALYNADRHLCFLTPIMIMPYIAFGLEKLLNDDGIILYVLSIFYMAISNIFFFYHIVLIVFLYVLVKVLLKHNSTLLSRLAIIFKVGIFSLISICMAAFILLPIIKTLMFDSRLHLDNYFSFLYSINYYKALLTILFSGGETKWTCLGFASPSIIAVVLLIKKRKQESVIFAFFCLSILFIMFPIFGKIFNGLAYVANRWTWIIALLVGYIVSINFIDMVIIDYNSIRIIVIVTVLYGIFYILFGDNKPVVFLQISVILIALCLNMLFQNIRYRQFAMLIVFMTSIVIISRYFYTDIGNNYIRQSVLQNEVNDIVFNDVGKVMLNYKNEVSDTEYSRFAYTTQKDIMNNYSANSSSIDHYFPISNSSITRFFTNIGMSHTSNYYFNGYDNRAILTSLASVKYYISKDSKSVPYGYKKVKSNEEYDIYKNKFFLPVLYSYDSIISDKNIEKLNYVSRQELMMKSAVVNEYKGVIKNSNIEDIEKIGEKPINVKYITDNILVEKDRIIVYKKNQKIRINFTGHAKSETYLAFENLNFLSFTEYDLYNNKILLLNNKVYNIDPNNQYPQMKYTNMTKNDKKKLFQSKIGSGWGTSRVVINIQSGNNIKKSIDFRTNRHQAYGGLHNVMINLGYNKDKVEYIDLTFPNVGLWTFDRMYVCCDELLDYERNVEGLKSGNVTNISISNDKILANVNSDVNKYLCASIPFSDGWKAYVDGVETPVYLTNYYHMGIDVPKGKHEIKLVYNNKFITYGRILTVIGFILFVVIIIYNKKKCQMYINNESSNFR